MHYLHCIPNKFSLYNERDYTRRGRYEINVTLERKKYKLFILMNLIIHMNACLHQYASCSGITYIVLDDFNLQLKRQRKLI